MKSVFTHVQEIEAKLREERHAVLFLDFDGTLAGIVETPNLAHMSRRLKQILESLRDRVDVVIVSGRSLKDIREKIDIPDVSYAGNHGLEWKMGSGKDEVNVPDHLMKALKTARAALETIPPRFKGALIEDKRYTVAVHYRKVDPERTASLRKAVYDVLAPFLEDGTLVITRGKKVLDVRPNVAWNKGDFALMATKYFQRTHGAHLTIFIGDDETDEDAFRALPDGITIRVGESKATAARYYVRTRADVDRFLTWLAELPQS
jgi:trehalose-phosphatase